MAKIFIDIENCNKCPYKREQNPQSTDGWDRMIDWFCTDANRIIQGAVEWHEERHIKIPDWCPRLLEE